ncbi:hypothetical protein C7T36_18385 [Rhodococcus sp. AD45-ID]|uniref:hypothetical protein n=1 Tax=unclassified Rhodococcus (in: high G+C Gram-positive bacteria) TaxID=192944 RepID=UPI0005D33B33|nr:MULTISPECIES: hypothetical protein [unclassified Rhodococcus (in: high G+C Gram-positive bacteria)]KJF21949.1 hypothetical protein SZ00_02593 [Rhodococcus sp. AD45]PSR39646.1 hypothetical protein C7T36_18385 [Rhodococcus sp. AD45-ID]
MPPKHPTKNDVTPADYRSAARVLLADKFSEACGSYVAESVWCNTEADRLESAALVERLAHIAWTASQDAAYNKSHDTDENPPVLIEWQDRTDDDREFTRAGIRAILAQLEADNDARVYASINRLEGDDLVTELAKAIHEYEFEGEPRACGGDVMFRPLAAAVLAHLASEGDLVPEGGMPLTAEQVEDVRGLVNDKRVAYTGFVNRLRALFPATEPAERVDHGSVDDGMGSEWQRCKADCGIEIVRPGKAQCYCTEPTDEVDPAPAVPAEEETKAETGGDFIEIVFTGPPAAISGRFVEVENPQGASISVGEWIDRGDGFWALRIPYTSSPVVPAPTETGPWPTWEAVPGGIEYRGTHGPCMLTEAVWINRDHNRYVRIADGATQLSGFDDGHMNARFAPFVAAEEKDA